MKNSNKIIKTASVIFITTNKVVNILTLLFLNTNRLKPIKPNNPFNGAIKILLKEKGEICKKVL
ncbi:MULTISPECIES: hypothetical protein [unclassified Chryseobacterium]|uniref:hypothetical protein n=1 Tax=unclassified Chryseobacterium TaxID=2593645 RepID=UPI00103CBCE3|nr:MULTISPECIES: hypothetical protein [unclassified Chryseobacterium]